MPSRREDRDRDERVSMHSQDPEAVLRALLQVDMNDEPADDQTRQQQPKTDDRR